MAIETKKTYCRFCLGCCAMDIDVDGDELIALRGDPDNVLSGGYTCLRGRELITMHQHPDRIRGVLKREGDNFVEMDQSQALDEVAAKLQSLLEQYGGRSIATYNGSWAFTNYPTLFVSKAFHRAIDSPSLFSPITLDQPAKAYMPARFGAWSAGVHSFKDADVVMFIGCNTVVSQYSSAGGLPPYNPYRRLQDALDKGVNVIVIDPRETETARRARLHLQVRPGEDPTLLAGIIRIIIDERLYDKAFCDEFVDSISALRDALEPFTPDYAAKRSDVPEQQLYEAARMFAGGNKGAASTGTGPEMAPNGSLTEHMVTTLNAICGRFYREGENPTGCAPLSPARPRKAQVIFPPKAWGEHSQPTRFRGLTQLGDELPCNVMADEILTPGAGQIRALFVNGGNPVVAFPNQDKVARAMEDLELLVALDPWFSATSRRAHYIFGPKLQLEREEATLLGEIYFEESYSHYTDKVTSANANLLEEWELYWELATRMGIPLEVNGVALDMTQRPSKFEITEIMTQGSAVPLQQVRDETITSGGKIFNQAVRPVAPKSERNQHRFKLLPEDVAQQLKDVITEPLNEQGQPQSNASYSHLLVSRRIKQFFNSTGHNFNKLKDKGTTNYAYIHSSDLAKLNLASETLVEIVSEAGTIAGVVKASDDVKPGVISMAHAFGDTTSNTDNVRQQGSSTNVLASDEKYYDPITGQARQSAIPVNIRVV
ncbi:hypothetical protein EYC98_18550 [Halieaceae bacterium IMCC14734]|uniref:4Fe-4S Mo/W bis-MGD-type domain-containing protein n=1 Tax=Candidatus Litorirhabdus singularis TaxID=2518993 RepID=A0ABT3TKP1_9GAMM|nr:molybdopterin-dependent oxidoreductase [Candidatus Litorirhabdus singularis]MCX2982868.1 hypothetical protein [Candidatus Litorirhabdus singularis]